MDLAPVGRSGLQCSQTKPLQQDPDTLTQKRGATEGEERRKGGDKVTRGEKMEKGREGAMGEALCGSSCSPKHAGVMGCQKETQTCNSARQNLKFKISDITYVYQIVLPDFAGYRPSIL